MTVVQRRWWVVAVAVACAVAVALAGLALIKPVYEATATLQVPAAAVVDSTGRPDDVTYTDRLMNTYKHIAQTRSMGSQVAKRVGRVEPVPLSVKIEPNTDLIKITARDADARRARRAANLAATILIQRVQKFARGAEGGRQTDLNSQLAPIAAEIRRLQREIVGTRDIRKIADLSGAIRIRELDYRLLAQQAAQLRVSGASRSQALTLVEPAGLPGSPSSPRTSLVLGLALFLGLLGGAGIAFLLERRQPRLYTVGEIESAAGASVLATIPMARRVHGLAVFNSGSAQQEAFGKLRARLIAGEDDHAPGTLLVTSANEGEGKSVVAANLAVSLARAGRRVLLVDIDMRRPGVHRLFDAENDSGFSDLLQDPVPSHAKALAEVRSTYVSNLHVLPSGPEPGNPAELLASPRIMKLIEWLRSDYHFVVLDAPALLRVSDTTAVAGRVDGVILVVGRAPANDADVQAARRHLEGIGARQVGVVINRWPAGVARHRQERHLWESPRPD